MPASLRTPEPPPQAVTRNLRLGAFGLGVTYAMTGVGAVLGGAVAGWAARRLGVGPTVILARWVTPVR